MGGGGLEKNRCVVCIYIYVYTSRILVDNMTTRAALPIACVAELSRGFTCNHKGGGSSLA